MKRREFVGRLGIGSAALLSSGAIAGAKGSVPQSGRGGGHDHEQMSGELASVVVSFGQWLTEPPLDRRTNEPPAPAANQHLLLPFVANVRAGGAVMFVISGLHNVQIFAPGTKPSDINIGLTIPVLQPPPLPPGVEFPPLIDDPANRIYRGPDPTLVPLDRTETVTFAEPGRYLVICGFLPHFLDNMFGFVNVVGKKRGRG
jgi:hypothetical protein